MKRDSLKLSKIFFFFLFVSIYSNMMASSLTLYNDAPFELTAIVQSASGQFLAQMTIAPGTQSLWTEEQKKHDFDVPLQPNASITPYVVIWKCSSGGYYSICTGVSPGSYVSANFCQGNHACEPKKAEPEESK